MVVLCGDPPKLKKKLWTGESEPADIKINYSISKCVLELRERLEEVMKLAQEELKKNQVRYKKTYGKKTKEQ